MTETEENEFMADDWATLQRLLYRNSWNEDLGGHRSPYAFRGMTDTNHDLRTLLQRFVGDSDKWDLPAPELPAVRVPGNRPAQIAVPPHGTRLAPRTPDDAPQLDLLTSSCHLLRDGRFT